MLESRVLSSRTLPSKPFYKAFRLIWETMACLIRSVRIRMGSKASGSGSNGIAGPKRLNSLRASPRKKMHEPQTSQVQLLNLLAKNLKPLQQDNRIKRGGSLLLPRDSRGLFKTCFWVLRCFRLQPPTRRSPNLKHGLEDKLKER